MNKILIVGAGLAGITLARHLEINLLKNNNLDDFSFEIIDPLLENTSSKVAAGLYNPIVFKRLAKSWNIDILLEYMSEYYTSIESEFGTKILYPLDIYKILSDENQVNFWKQKAAFSDSSKYLDEEIITNYRTDILEDNTNIGRVINGGWLNIPNYLEHLTSKYISNNQIMKSNFDYDKLQIQEDGIIYNNQKYAKIVFCTGWESTKCKFFSYLPFVLSKGEVLDLQLTNRDNVDNEIANFDQVLNKGVFIFKHLSNYKCGSTYNWKDLSQEPSEDGKNEILSKLDNFLLCNKNIIQHRAGIRPTVKDRRPMLGSHPKHSNIFIFNGLGTKGVMLAPYYANMMANYILNNEKLDQEVDIKRFETN
jgi:glycine oxidase